MRNPGPRLYPLAIFGLWTGVALVYASHLYMYHALRDGSASWTASLAESFADWYVWAVLSIPILKIAKRLPLNAMRNVLLHVLLSLAFGLVQVSLHSTIDAVLIHGDLSWKGITDSFGVFFARTFHFGLLVYWVIVIARTAVERYKDQQVAASQLEARLAQAQLQALRMQLHPHFLFNALNTIASLMHKDVTAADRMVVRLADLLRISLAARQAQEVPLKEELEFLEKYLEIEQFRFRDRLQVKLEIASETLDALVPAFILQPLVENSIRHGIARSTREGMVEVRALREDGRLQIHVRDNGAGIPQGEIVEGIGLSNTRRRLEQLYGDRGNLHLRSEAGVGTDVLVAIPFRQVH